MTDFTSKNTVYYDVLQYNSTNTPIPANSDNKLIYPLFNDANNYSVGVNKASFDLSTIPLTASNIGLKRYQVGLKIGTTEELSYVRQVNANQDNFVWNCPKGSTLVTKYKYTSAGVLTEVSSQNLLVAVPNIQVYNFVIDDYSNLFVIAYDNLSEVPNKVYVIDENNNLLQTLEYTHVKHIYIDRGQNLYICDEGVNPSVYIFGMNNEIGQVNLTQKTTLTTNKAGNPLVNLLFCVADNEIIVGYNQNTITLYNAQYQAQTDIQEVAITQLQNLANISSTANTYVLANSNEIDDTIYGTQNQMVYNVNNNTQYTSGSVISSLAITRPTNGYGFAVGTDQFTYAIIYPSANLPANYFQVNNLNSIHSGCIWSAQQTGLLFGLGLTYLYYAWNYSCPPNQNPPNVWTECGEFQLPAVGSPTPINVDIQSTTNKALVVGSDNNLYISQNPISQIELIFNGLRDGYPYNSLTWGLRQWDANGNQQNSLINNFSVWSNNASAMFKQGNRYFVAYGTGTSVTLNIYSIIDYSLLSTHPNFDTNMIAMTYLPQTSSFVYQNNAQQIVFRDISTLALKYTIQVAYNVGSFYELDALHLAVCENGGNGNVYIYNLTTLTLVNTVLLPNIVCDIAVNQKDIQNGASTLFAMVQTQQDNNPVGQQIYKITFTDSTYTQTAIQTMIYETTRSIAQINVHQNIGDLLFIEGDYNNSTGVFNNVQFKSLMQNGGYSTNNIIVASMSNQPFMSQYWIPFKGSVYMPQSTSSTHRWTQVTSNVQLKAISVSRSNPNKLYGLGSADSLIYQGNLINNSITFTRFTEFTQTYDYLSNTPNTDPTIQSKLYLYGLQSQNLITSLDLGDECGAIARNDVTSQYMVSQKLQGKVQALNAETLASVFTSTLTGAYRIFTKNGSDIDAGGVNIYNISVLIDAINNAFVEATTKINQALGSGTIATPPSLSLNYQTGLCTLSYPSVLTQSANGILFNLNLLNLVYYQSVLDQQSGLYKLVLNPQQESITQNSKTIYAFNELSRILFQSNTIFVIGNWYGINSFSHIITDIDVPTDQFVENLGQKLYYQPPFLRSFFMNSNLPLDRIQLQILYEYRNGSQFTLLINPQQNMTCKLQFIRKF
jgi:hypothetical protein